MKAFRAFITVLSLVIPFIFSGCGGGGGGSEPIQDKNLALLAGTSTKIWIIDALASQRVLKDAGDSTQYWKNFTLTISGTKGATSFAYSCGGRPKVSVWPASGTWSFDTSSPGSTIIRDPGNINDELHLGYAIDPAGKNLQITFTFNNPSGGYTRTENVNASWTFNMIPQTN